MSRPFIVPEERYHKNINDARDVEAGPALFTTKKGYKPGVIVYNGRDIRGVLPLEDAIRLANQIADSISYHKRKETR